MIKLLELFGGIGACTAALERIGIEYEIADYVEIDKFAVKSYNAIHGTNFDPQDITKWDKDIDVDLIMHGSPCQDFSIAGNNAGGDKGSGTRSSLMYETVRIVEKLKPKFVIWENVKNVLSKKHVHNFERYLDEMERLGYTNYYKVLNAKCFGVPQNRNRIFVVSILGGGEFQFPNEFPLEIRLKDILEEEVDEKYYISEKALAGMIYRKKKCELKGTGFGAKIVDTEGIAPCITARYYKDGKDCLIQVAQLYGTEKEPNPQAGRIYSPEGISPALDTCQGGNRMPKIIVKELVLSEPFIVASRGRNPENPSDRTSGIPTVQMLEPNREGICNCLTTVQKDNLVVQENFRVRKLTPKECWRLMGFDDEYFEKAQAVNSNTQLYKQAGNSIVVDVLAHIFTKLLKG